MITQATVFVLGAGASRPYGFPTGAELRREICFDFAKQYSGWLMKTQPDRDRRRVAYGGARTFCDVFWRSTDSSIDFWLRKNPEFLDVGKLAIMFRILEAEAKGQMREKCQNLEHDWCSYLYRRLTSDLTAKDDCRRFAENQIDFMTFNYDRFLEQLLFESLTDGFCGISRNVICETIAKRAIIHVYGQIGKLEWEDQEHGVPYGMPLANLRPRDLMKNLYIIHAERENPNLEKVAALLARSHRLFFLGFGYAQENLRMLGIPEVLNSEQMIFGTARGASDKEIHDIRSCFTTDPKTGTGTKVRSGYLHIEDTDCLGLLKKYL
jgi:hypothetical protein